MAHGPTTPAVTPQAWGRSHLSGRAAQVWCWKLGQWLSGLSGKPEIAVCPGREVMMQAIRTIHPDVV